MSYRFYRYSSQLVPMEAPSNSCNIENMMDQARGRGYIVLLTSYSLSIEALLDWQVALIVIGVLLWFLALGLGIVGVVLLILLAREKCKPSTIPV